MSLGYVQLVRRGDLPSRRSTGARFVRRGDEWVEDDSSDVDADVPDDGPADGWADPDPLDPEVEAAIEEARHPHRGEAGLSARSRMNMRRLFVSLPWELVGPRPALVSLTYPGTWQPWVPTGRVWEAHRRAFERRWVRRWREPLVGVWVKEFQTSGRPHLHLYVGLSSSMSAEDFAGLRERTLLRHRLEHEHGRYEGRRLTPPVGLPYGGEFGTWLRVAWADIVGTSGPDKGPFGLDPGAHDIRGVDVAVVFWSDEAEATTDRTAVAQYLARETGKWRQKQPPPGFSRIGRYYGVWGRSVGFRPETTTTALDPDVAAEVDARLTRWVNWKLRAQRHGAPPTTALVVRRPGDGVTAFGLGPDRAAPSSSPTFRSSRWPDSAAASTRLSRIPGEHPGGSLEEP